MAFNRNDISKIATLDASLKQAEQKYLALKSYSVSFAFALDYPEPPTREPNVRGRTRQSFDMEINPRMPAYPELMIVIRSVIEDNIKSIVADFRAIGIDLDHDEIMDRLIHGDPLPVEDTPA